MSEDAILAALEGMQREIAEMKAQITGLSEKFVAIIGHEIRIARLEVDLKSLEIRVGDLGNTCIERKRYVDMLDQGLPQEPEDWWDGKMAKAAGLIGWTILMLALPKILKALGAIQ